MAEHEQKPLPGIARSAATYADAEFQRVVNALAGQTLEVMGLDPNEGWRCDFAAGVAFREVPAESKPTLVEDVEGIAV